MFYIAMAFGSVSQLLRAGEVLKKSGLSVLAVPRKITGCGVLLLIESESAPAALSILATQGNKPVEVFDYTGLKLDPGTASSRT